MANVVAVSENIRRRRRGLEFVERNRRKKRMPPQMKLRRFERAHQAHIMALIKPYEEMVKSELFPVIETIVSESKVRVDDPTDIIERIFNGIRVRFLTTFTDQSIEQATLRTAAAIDRENRDLFRRQFKTVFNADPVAAEPWLEQEVRTFVAENASLIKTLPEENLADIEQMVFRDARRGESPQKIKANILEQFESTEYKARRIARDQVSKFNGRLSELRQRQTGITRYEWQTSEDGRVRSRANTSGYSDHARLNGKIFSWDDPPVTVFKGKRAGERNHPGQDIQCRCHAIPVMDDLL